VGQRQKLLNVEKDAIEELAAALGEEVPQAEQFAGPSGTPLLSDVRLQLLREHKAKMQALKKQRGHEVQELAKVRTCDAMCKCKCRCKCCVLL